ncbi:hypothetical protein [Streptomyces abikoensis]|uniref:hypothetical protein n=1 Tax=Streptomyces abikoensis TaxID=97398 RepID=UPI00167C0614|nr:hypothetical protein [Streptomyces abikoensis]
MTICTVREVRPFLPAHGGTIDASTARFRTPADSTSFLAPDETTGKIEATR